MTSQHQLPPYHPETEQFRREVDNPLFVQDEQSHLTYAVRMLNQDRDGQTPVVLNLPFALNGKDRLGIAVLSAYAEHIEHPIITMDMVGAGDTTRPGWRWGWGALTSVSRAAASETRVLNKMGVQEASFVGLCLGGAMAYKKAKAFGERAKQLITISGVGFSALTPMELRNLLPNHGEERVKAQRVSREAMQDLNLARVWRHEGRSTPLKGRFALTFGALGLSVARGAVVNNLGDLAASTKITAITVPNDRLADEAAHRQAITERNNEYPDTAQLIVLNTDRGHAFTTYNAPAMAQLTNALLAS